MNRIDNNNFLKCFFPSNCIKLSISEPKTYANMVSKNTNSSGPQSLPVTSNTTSPVSNLPPAHKIEQPITFKAEGTPVSSGQVNREKSEGVMSKAF